MIARALTRLVRWARGDDATPDAAETTWTPGEPLYRSPWWDARKPYSERPTTCGACGSASLRPDYRRIEYHFVTASFERADRRPVFHVTPPLVTWRCACGWHGSTAPLVDDPDPRTPDPWEDLDRMAARDPQPARLGGEEPQP